MMPSKTESARILISSDGSAVHTHPPGSLWSIRSDHDQPTWHLIRVSGDLEPPRESADADEQRLRSYASALAVGIEAALPGWVERTVERTMADAGMPVDGATRAAASAAGARAQTDVGPPVRALLAQDIDEQRASPLAVVRRAVVYPTEVLRHAGVVPPTRDETEERLFPDDDYGIGPVTFADLDPSLHEPGLAWGAAKAYVHLTRRRAEDRR